MTVNIENLCVTSFGGMDEEQLGAIEAWMSTCLSFTDLGIDDGVPKAQLQEGQDALHAFADQVGCSCLILRLFLGRRDKPDKVLSLVESDNVLKQRG